MATQLFFNGKPVNELPEGAKLIRKVDQAYYGDDEYTKKLDKSAYDYFRKQQEIREEQEKYHG